MLTMDHLWFEIMLVFLLLFYCNAFSMQSKYVTKGCAEIKMVKSEPTIADVYYMSAKETIRAIRGNVPVSIVPNVDIVKLSPTPTTFIFANPKAFLEKPTLARLYGFDLDQLKPSTPLSVLAALLPVIYIADVHPEYGTLGFALNKLTSITMNSLHPTLKCFRNRRVYLGGTQNKGSSFTMLHRKVGFPENRPFKGVPGNSDFKLFFSPDYAMANELCLTNDALPTDFKFFQWNTVWLPRQLDLEYEQKLWLTLSAPASAIFEDETDEQPLWRRFAASIPAERLQANPPA